MNSETGGFFNSLAFDSSGCPAISYCQGTYYYTGSSASNDLKLAYFDGNSWNIETIDSNGNVGIWSSFSFDADDRPSISYYDETNGVLKYAHFNGTTWNIEVVDSEGDVGEYSSLAFDNSGNPHISYYDKTNHDLKYARYNGSSWEIGIIDGEGDVGRYCSLSIDASGSPAVSYYDATNGGLKFAYRGIWPPPHPDLSVSPSSHGFGSLNIGDTSEAQSFSITNTGDADLEMGAVTIIGTDASEFSIQNDTCSGQSIAPLGTCTVDAAFSPTSAGEKNANLSISSNDPDAPTLDVPLSGIGIRQYTLIANSTGTGTGTITSSPSGIDCGSNCSETFNEGAEVTLTATPDADSTFDGWSGVECSGTGTCQVTVNEDTTVTATFTLKAYTIAASAGIRGSISPSGDVIVNHGASQAFTITADTNYHVADVFVDGSSVGAVTTHTFTNVTVDHTIEAIFSIDSFTLSVAKAGTGEGTVSPDVGQHTYDYGTVVDLTAIPAESSRFTGWSGDASGAGDTSITMDSNKSVTATFTIKTYNITATAGAGGSISPSEAVTVNYGSHQTFTITPDTNYHVSDVLVDGSSVGAVTRHTFSNVTATHTIEASFAVDTYTITLTIDPSGGGSVSKNPDKGSYSYGEQVVLTATANPGYAFSGWSGDISGSTNPTTITMDGNKSVTATFTEVISPPKNLKIIGYENESDVTLEWDANTEQNLDGYKIHYKSGSPGEPYNGIGAAEGNSPVNIGNVTTSTLHGLKSELIYFLAVTACNTDEIESDYSNEVSIPIGVTSITSSTDNGLYPAEQEIDIILNFSEPVTLGGDNLIISLNTRSFAEIDPFTSKASVSCTYTVQTGDESNDLNVEFLELSEGATLQSAGGIDCDLSVPQGSNLADNKDIVIDAVAPSSTAICPTYANEAPISIAWTSSDATSGVASTELWYKKGSEGTWANTGLDPQSGTEGTFPYTPSQGDGTYYFATRSTDNAGNVEARPSGNGDDSTIYDTVAPDPPVITTKEGNDYATTDSTITLEGTCPADTVVIYVNGSTEGVTYTPGETSWSYSGTLASGENGFEVTAEDAAGNLSDAASITIASLRPYTPELSSPTDDASEVSLTPVLQTSNFSHPDPDSTHALTGWQISMEEDFSSRILDITSDTHFTSLTVPHSILDEGTTYFWRVIFYDSNLAASDWSEAFSFVTAIYNRDQNGNGVPDDQECEHITNQDNQKCVKTAAGDGEIEISSTTSFIEWLESIDPDIISDTSNRPENLPFGLITFKLIVNDQGEAEQLTVNLSRATSDLEALDEFFEIGRWYKYDTINGWQDFSDHATFNPDERVVVLSLTDGGAGDADGTKNGIIVDPSGLGTGNIAPEASFKANPTSGEEPLRVHFDATASKDVDGEIVSYDWNCGDGDTGFGETTSHKYSSKGTYTVTLTVTDDDGATGKATATITVKKWCPISVALSGSPMEPFLNVLREFRDRILKIIPGGDAFISLYYDSSPSVANVLMTHETLRTMVRWSLVPVVGMSWMALHYGLWVTLALVVLLLCLMSAGAVIVARRIGLRGRHNAV